MTLGISSCFGISYFRLSLNTYVQLSGFCVPHLFILLKKKPSAWGLYFNKAKQYIPRTKVCSLWGMAHSVFRPTIWLCDHDTLFQTWPVIWATKVCLFTNFVSFIKDHEFLLIRNLFKYTFQDGQLKRHFFVCCRYVTVDSIQTFEAKLDTKVAVWLFK